MSEGGSNTWNLPQKWLVVRLGAMGDVLLTSGVLEYWRRQRGLEFVLLTKAPWAELLAGHPAVSKILPLDGKRLTTGAFSRFARDLAQEYRGWGLLDLHGNTRSRLLALFWKGAVRRYRKMALERRLYGLLRTQGVRRRLRGRLEAVNVPQRYALALEEQAPAVEELAPRIWLGNDELARAREKLQSLRAEGRPLAALHPLAAHVNKTWPAQHWLELLQGLREAGWGWYFLGRGQLPHELRQVAGEPCFVNATSSRESAALLAVSDVLVTGDSGPLHLGVAAGTPSVALFGPTARVWGFYPPPPHVVLEENLDCRPCSLHGKKRCKHDGRCLEQITPERVLQAVLELNRQPRGAPDASTVF